MKDLIKQPNGKYCTIGYQGKMDFVNYTEQDIINLYIEEAKRDMENAKNYGVIIERSIRSERSISNEYLKKMGFDKPYDELVKYIPRKPKNMNYVPRDCETTAKCPNCNKEVKHNMGYIDRTCKSCGQLLDWQ
mgnify:CR=1 FL=1